MWGRGRASHTLPVLPAESNRGPGRFEGSSCLAMVMRTKNVGILEQVPTALLTEEVSGSPHCLADLERDQDRKLAELGGPASPSLPS